MTPQQFTAYLLVLLMPLSAAIPLSRPLWVGIHWLYVTPAIEAADFPALLLVLLTVLEPRHALSQAHRATFARLLAVLAALGLLSVWGSLLPLLSFYFTLRWALAAGVCWALVEADLKLQHLTAVFIGTLGIQSLIAIGQAVHQGPLGLPGELAPFPNTLGASTIDLGSYDWLRAYGLTFHPNVLAGFLTVGLILTLPMLDRQLARLAWWLMSLALLATFSRSALLAAALTLPLVVLWLWRNDKRLRRGLVITFGAGVCAVTAAGWLWRGPIIARLGIEPVGGTAASTPASILGSLDQDDRLKLNGVALRFIAAHPLLGLGAGNSPLAMQRSRAQPHYPHNVALMLGAEVGIAGALLWLALLGVAVWRLRVAPASSAKPWLVAGVGAFVALQLIGLLDCYPWSLNAGRMLTVTVLATIEVATRHGRRV